MDKWNRKLGTSKREQGITTPPAPQHPKRRAEYFAVKIIEQTPWYKKLWRKISHKIYSIW